MLKPLFTGSVHDLLRYEDGRLFWRSDVARRSRAGDEAGSLTGAGYWQISYRYIMHRRHRVIYYMHTGELPDLIDHIDRDKSNDRIENLRPASKSLNVHNSTYIKGMVPYRGVTFNKNKNKYQAELTVDGRRMYLGRFETAEEAHLVYEREKSLRTAHLV